MKRCVRLTALILALLWVHDFAFAQKAARRAAAGDVRVPALPPDGSKSADPARLTAVRLATVDGHTRVIMEVSRPVVYEVGRLPEDLSKDLPPRIFIDIAHAKLGPDAPDAISVQDGPLKQIRVGQFDQDTVRVVLDMTSPQQHDAFLLPDPFRVVLDIPGQKAPAAPAAAVRARVPSARAQSARAKITGIRKIVLDPGHGGKDPGAMGAGGIAEKDIVLSVAKKLAAKLTKEMGIEVVLTRSDDRFIPLEDRTAMANAENADLFISLHVNASPNDEARGVETYYLDNTTDEASMRLAARENSTSRKNVSDLQFILSDMTQNMKLEDSVTLAHRLQGSLVENMGTQLRDIRDLGVKKALFYVLVGARMPSVLVEMFFITHREEARAMSRQNFQDQLADAIYDGIRQYNHGMLAAKTL